MQWKFCKPARCVISQRVTLIELRGESQDLSADTLVDFASDIIDARGLCSAGRSEDALDNLHNLISRMSNTGR